MLENKNNFGGMTSDEIRSALGSANGVSEQILKARMPQEEQGLEDEVQEELPTLEGIEQDTIEQSPTEEMPTPTQETEPIEEEGSEEEEEVEEEEKPDFNSFKEELLKEIGNKFKGGMSEIKKLIKKIK